ncbi:DUF1697 domain-containing protein [Kocuria sp. cx-455]|uniref:DUF1697 domain-containing protein n=1 Tax=Kocuria sp. cx-455 TaxID=2771377 RepID=UPI00168603CC|nr:DUF1697 domain-containing protein [Kocuria sp. cx-455]MBD2764157.1 DUF1697 domain-containing protein [Kocuria sp. cx-455]
MNQPTAYFLRGINVGVNNRVPMVELRVLLTQQLGAHQVTTYLQSGNVVCVPPGDPAEFAGDLAAAIESEFGVRSPVIHRTLEDLSAVLAADPLRQIATDDKLYQVHFCDRPVLELDLAALPIHQDERIVVNGSEIYVWYGSDKGIHASKLPVALGRQLPDMTITARNMRTVRKVADLLDAAASQA